MVPHDPRGRPPHPGQQPPQPPPQPQQPYPQQPYPQQPYPQQPYPQQPYPQQPYPQQPYPYQHPQQSPPPAEEKRRWPVVLVVVLALLVVGGVVLAITQMTRFAPAEDEMIPIEGPTQVSFTEGNTYWVYVPEGEKDVARCDVTSSDGTPVPDTTSSTTYTVSLRGEPYSTINVLPPTKEDPTASGVTHTVTCDTPNAVAGPAPNTPALAGAVVGFAVAGLSFFGAVGFVIVRTWIRTLGSRGGRPFDRRGPLGRG